MHPALLAIAAAISGFGNRASPIKQKVKETNKMAEDILIEIQNNTDIILNNEEKEIFQEISLLIEEMNIVAFEPYLDEDLNMKIPGNFPGKYQVLSILRDLFIEYKSIGDTKLLIEMGACGHNCGKKCSVINLQGNNSGKNFAFRLDKSDSNITRFHSCAGFVDKSNTPKFIDPDMMMNSLRKDAEMKGEDTSRYDDEMKRSFIEIVQVFYEFYNK